MTAREQLNRIPVKERYRLANNILSTIKEPWLMIGVDDGQIGYAATDKITFEMLYRLLTTFLVDVAEENGKTPIQILSELGNDMSELMEQRDEGRK